MTLGGMAAAIGLIIDDAIVVVENIVMHRDAGEHRAGELEVLGFLGVDAEPAEMRQAVFRCPLWFVLRNLAEVVVKTLRGTAVKAGPESRFSDGGAAGGSHVTVIVRDPADHVGVRFNEAHREEE